VAGEVLDEQDALIDRAIRVASGVRGFGSGSAAPASGPSASGAAASGLSASGSAKPASAGHGPP
jgi:hypothetical protein